MGNLTMKRKNVIINTVKSHKVVSLIVAALVVVGGVGTAVAFYPDSEPKKAAVVTSQQPQEESTPVEESTPTVQEQAPAPVEQEPAPEPAPTNPFQQGFSAWYAFNRRQELGKSMSADYKNERSFCESVTSKGQPSQYAIACKITGSNAHVVIVEQVNNDGTFWVSEMNSKGQASITDTTPAGGWNVVDYKLVPLDHLPTYKFVQ